MKKRAVFFILFLLLFILSSISVQAVGISSWGSVLKKTDFVPNTQQTYAFMLRTTTNFAQDYQLSAEGDLAHLITFTPSNLLENVAPGQDPWFNVILTFPESEGNLTPGIHNIWIGVAESSAPGGAMIGGKTAVRTRIEVRILHPGKYLVATLNTPNVNINEPVPMSIKLENWGKEIIQNARAKIDIFTKEGEFKETIYSNTVSVPSAEEVSAQATLDTLGYLPGDYYAEGYVEWDGQQIPINDTFRIGVQDIKINSYTATFEQDKINPLKINIESVWNSITSDVYAVMKLPNGPVQTPTINLGPWENINLSTYWDTTGVELGEYEVVLDLHYAGETKTKKVMVEVLEKVEVQEQKPLGFNYTYLIIIIVVILIIINIFLWVYLVKKSRKRAQQNI